MAYDYDKLYGEKPDALGEPTSVFVNFFEQFTSTAARVLDVGCGQGRDALFIARKGHTVVGLDISANGIRDLVSAAIREKLHVKGVVADLTTWQPEGQFDVIVIDRTLHMLPKRERLATLDRLLGHVADKGWVLIADEASNIKDFADYMLAHALNWRIEFSKRGYLFVQRD